MMGEGSIDWYCSSCCVLIYIQATTINKETIPIRLDKAVSIPDSGVPV